VVNYKRQRVRIPGTDTLFDMISPIGEMVSLDVWDVEAQVRFLHRRPKFLPLKPLMDEVLFCKQEKSVRFRTGAPKIILSSSSG